MRRYRLIERLRRYSAGLKTLCDYVILDDFHDDTLVVAVLLNLLLRRTVSEDFGNYTVPIALYRAGCCIAAILSWFGKYLNLPFSPLNRRDFALEVHPKAAILCVTGGIQVHPYTYAL